MMKPMRVTAATSFLLTAILVVRLSGQTGEGEPETSTKPSNLIDIARNEAEKERSATVNRIRTILRQLGIYTDPSLDFVQQKIREILSFGPTALPFLVEAMENPSDERTIVNSGRMAARILAGIDDPRVETEAYRLLTTGNDRAKINALHCLGSLGGSSYLKEIEALLQSENSDLVSEALFCLGRLKSPNTIKLATPFLQAEVAGQTAETTGRTADEIGNLKLAAIRSLAQLGDPAAEELILPVIENSVDLKVISAGIEFSYKSGTLRSANLLFTIYEKPYLKKKQRWAIISAITEIGKRSSKDDIEPVLEFFKKLLDSRDNRTIREAAIALNELGDDSGVKVLTQQLDRLITKHSSAEYYFRRGEIYLKFKKYKLAIRDFNDGLRKDRTGGRIGMRKVLVSLARCYAATGRYADAERTLRKAGLQDITRFPYEYEEFRAMAENERYAKVFQPGWK